MKELEYCEEIKNLRIELAQKAKEIESLKKLNKEVEAKGESSPKNREKEDFLARMLQLEKELYEKHQLELEVTQLNGTLQVMKHLEGDDDGDIHDKMEKLSGRLERKKECLEELSRELLKKERESNDELQEARKELIMLKQQLQVMKYLDKMEKLSEILECEKKRLEELSGELVKKERESNDELQEARKELTMEVVDDDDTKLRHLWIEYGDDVCNAVKTALSEVNEYNASGRYVVPELWNFRKGRKATMKEVLKYIFGQIETTSKRRRP
uniref:Factor of DNA methylation 1-5/IDN2 domain-containing protein n=1 Tax=Oryza rufipogon TaxID=4529 RepID=A0A0E0MRB2_ORYRU